MTSAYVSLSVFLCIVLPLGNCVKFDTLNNVKNFNPGYEQTIAANDLLIRILGKQYKNIEAWVNPEMVKNDKDLVTVRAFCYYRGVFKLFL